MSFSDTKLCIKEMANPDFVDDSTTRLFGVVNGKATSVQYRSLVRDLLDTNKCYLIDTGLVLFVWIGMKSSFQERKIAYTAAEDLLRSFRREDNIIRVIEGFERIAFRFEFGIWPAFRDAVVPEVFGADVVGVLSSSVGSTLQVWRLDGDAKSPLMGTDASKFYTGDCYIFIYSYPGELGEESLVGTWLGRESLKEDQISATSEARKMVESFKFLPVQVSMFEGNEPPLFFSIFQNLIVYKGGVSTGYKKSLASKGLPDVTYSEDGLALFRVQKTENKNMLAVQVEAVAASLNSSYCYILQNGSSVFIWLGETSTLEDHECVMSHLDLLKPNVHASTELEHSESELFWDSIGGQLEYPSQIVGREVQSKARLFSCLLQKESSVLQVTNILSLDPDSLKTEEVFILEFKCDIYVWVGQAASSSMTVDALTVAKEFLINRASLSKDATFNNPVSEDLSSIFIIKEGSEPLFFRRLFKRPLVKNNVQSMRSAVMSLVTYVEGEEFQKEVLDFALERNLLKLFFENQDLQNLQNMRKHLLTLLKTTESHLEQDRSVAEIDDYIYANLAKEAMEFVQWKQEKIGKKPRKMKIKK